MQNDFSTLLRALIRNSGVKNQSVSIAVGYDLSYVSKWLSGKMLPSEKNIDETIIAITKCVIDSCLSSEHQKLFDEFKTDNCEELSIRISAALKEAYTASKRITSKPASSSKFNPIGDIKRALEIIVNGLRADADIIAIFDVFSLNRDSRLDLLGIKEGQFSRKYEAPSGKMDLIIDVLHCNNIAEDALFLIHFLSSFSSITLRLYSSSDAFQKIVCVINRESAISGIMLNHDRKLLAESEVNGSELCLPLWDTINGIKEQQELVFVRRHMHSFIIQSEYIKSLLATNIKWIVGHATELICPDSVYQELSQKIEEENIEELQKIHVLAQNAIKREQTRILLYESAISDLIATGIIDFYNVKFKISKEQIKQYIKTIIDICKNEGKVKMVVGGFNPDFKHIYNPYLYISDAISYVRLEDAYGLENIMIVNNEKIRELFNRFYDYTWDNRPDVVIDSSKVIIEKMRHYEAMVDALNS